MGFVGADIVALFRTARNIENDIHVLEDCQRFLLEAQSQIPNVWRGQDATRFSQSIQSEHLPAINRTIELFRTAAGDIRYRANRQQQAAQ